MGGKERLSSGRHSLRMKTFLWLLVAAFAVLSLCCWMISSVAMLSFTDAHTNGGLRLPAVTLFFLSHNGWILVCPLPGLIYAVALSRRRELTTDAVFAFTGTVMLAQAILFCVVAGACLLPYIALHTYLK
jgi:hypothetical protein